jgi:hypothetical protein
MKGDNAALETVLKLWRWTFLDFTYSKNENRTLKQFKYDTQDDTCTHMKKHGLKRKDYT